MSRVSDYNQPVPDSVAPKGGDFITFQPFPDAGPAILTVLGVKVLPDFENIKQDGTREVFDALEFIVGTITSAGPRFIKLWPMKNSIHEKSNYSKLYKAATGALPAPKGSNPSQIVGKGIQATLENVDKVSKKGTAYTATRLDIKSAVSVFPKLRAEIVPADKLYAALEAALTPRQQDGNTQAPPPLKAVKPLPAAKPAASTDTDEDAPF